MLPFKVKEFIPDIPKQRGFNTAMSSEAKMERQERGGFGRFCRAIARAWGPIPANASRL